MHRNTIETGNNSRKRYDFSANRPTPRRQMPAEIDRSSQKPAKVIVCPYCGENNAAWGTRRYCDNNFCQKQEKRIRQALVDSLAKNIKKGLYANYKIFREHLPGSGRVELKYDKALKKGFDEHAFYGTTISKDNTRWYIVDDYYFSIKHNENERLLIIHKN
jgi:hypothetical protein